MKIVSVVGARPQFIKLAPLSKVLRKNHEEIVVHTGQHYDFEMSKIFFEDLDISSPDFNLEVGSGSHAFQTGNIMIKLEEVLISEKPDLVLVFGDTNSTAAASFTAAKLNLPSAHVEAGLRNLDRHFPEEINRIVSDHLSVLNFAPTKTAIHHLKNEGLQHTAHLTGDVMIDILHQILRQVKGKETALDKHGLSRKSYNLMTIHRPDNADNPEQLARIFEAINRSEVKTVFPAHPRTAKALNNPKLKELISSGKIIVIEPVGYLEFISLLDGASKIITDSGGVQKEAYVLKTPCITLLDNTPWVETVDEGWNILLKPDVNTLAKAITEFNPDGEKSEDYGNGRASENILQVIENWWN